ncbi:MAG: hypothetical protein ACTSQJ_05445 [Promethearchaeota archaeon]
MSENQINILKIRRKKIQDQINSAIRILNSGIEPLEIADNFLSESMLLLKEWMIKRYPKLSDRGIRQKIRENQDFYFKLKNNRKRKVNFG